MLKGKDFKKHLLRAKQYAENFGRGEKSEVLPEDLETLHRRIELMKTACHNTSKKVQATMKDHGGLDKEKRMRKVAEYQVAVQMLDAGESLGHDSLMGQLYQLCGEAELTMSGNLVDAEIEVEGRVLAPLNHLAEQEIPPIIKRKKQLKELVSDMDSARTKYHNATERHRDQPGGAAKIESAKEELEDAQSKVEQCRDHLSTEMYSFCAKESENSKFLLEFINIQAEYHEKALKALREAIPRMSDACEQCNLVPVYGTELEEHLRRTNREIATVIEGCIAILAEIAMKEEGLFRIAGGASKVKKVKAAFDAGLTPDMDEIRDVHCIAGALKLYLRELPEPLLTYNLYNEWMQAAHLPHDERMQSLWLLCDKLPKPNYNNLRYLIKFLHKLSEDSDMNKMTPTNIAIVIGPNLLWQPDAGQSVLTTSSQSAIVDSLISHADYFFPGDIAFEPISKTSSPVPRTRKQYFSVPNIPVKPKTKSKHKSSIDLGTASAYNTLPMTVSKSQSISKSQIQVIHNNPEILNSTPVSMTSFPNKKDDIDDRQSIDSGIESSGPSSARPSLHGKPTISTDVDRPTTIIESEGSNITETTCHQEKISQNELDPGMFSLVTEQSIKRAITPPPKPPPPRSVHSDMYDTLFALQSLQGDNNQTNTVNDYLTTVRTLWDGQYMSQGTKRFSVGAADEDFPLKGHSEDVNVSVNSEGKQLGKERARASSESRILEASRVQQVLKPISEGLPPQLELTNKGLSISSTSDDVFNSGSNNHVIDTVISRSKETDLINLHDSAQQPIVPKRKKKSPVKEIDFGVTNTSDKSKTSDEDPFLAKEPTVNHSLSTSSSGSNLIVDTHSQDSTSPRGLRKIGKKPAPLPPTDRPLPSPSGQHPGATGSLERKQLAHNSSGSLDRKQTEKPPVAEQGGSSASLDRKHAHPPERPPPVDKLHIITTTSDKPADRPPVPDRPSMGPPPAVPKQQQDTNQGSPKLDPSISPGNKPERPRLPSDRPQVPPPEKPKTPAYDSSKTSPNILPYSVKPEIAPKSDNIAPLSPNANKNAKPPRPSHRPPPPKSGSRGSEKDFQFVRDAQHQQQQNAAAVRSISQEGETTNVPEVRTPEACETHL